MYRNTKGNYREMISDNKATNEKISFAIYGGIRSLLLQVTVVLLALRNSLKNTKKEDILLRVCGFAEITRITCRKLESLHGVSQRGQSLTEVLGL